MSRKTPSDYLRDVLRELDDITSFTSAGKQTFLLDAKTRKAVICSYEVIGEIAKRLPADLRQRDTQINWQKLIGFWDFLAHHYEEVILENVWSAVEDLPNLRAAVETLLYSLDEEQG